MTEAVQIALIAATLPALMSITSSIVTHILNRNAVKEVKADVASVKERVDHNVELSNSMLTRTTERKEEAEKKVEQIKSDELLTLRTQLAEANRTIALLTKPEAKP